MLGTGEGRRLSPPSREWPPREVAGDVHDRVERAAREGVEPADGSTGEHAIAQAPSVCVAVDSLRLVHDNGAGYLAFKSDGAGARSDDGATWPKGVMIP